MGKSPSHLLSHGDREEWEGRRREQRCLQQQAQDLTSTGLVTSHAEVPLDVCAVSKL